MREKMNGKKYSRVFALLFVNSMVFLVLFVAVETFYRIYNDGFTRGIAGIVNFSHETPFSNLGTSNWVIYDHELGYRLNPEKDDYNNMSVRHREITVPKPKSLYRIIYLGDSVPWDRNGFVSHTRDYLKERGRFEVINAGVPGYTSYQEVLFYEKYLASTTPDLVIWTYCLNDNHRFLHRFDSKGKMLRTKEAEQTFLRNRSYWDKIVSRSYLLTRFRMGMVSRTKRIEDYKYKFVWENRFGFNNAWKDDSWLDYECHLQRLKDLLDKQNVKLAIVIFPYEPQLFHRNDKENYDYVVKPQHKLIALCDKYQVPCLDLYPKFKDEYSQNKVLFRDGIHLNREGHHFTYLQVIQFLSENRLLSP